MVINPINIDKKRGFIYFSLKMVPNGEYMASRRLRAAKLSNRDEVEAGYNC